MGDRQGEWFVGRRRAMLSRAVDRPDNAERRAVLAGPTGWDRTPDGPAASAEGTSVRQWLTTADGVTDAKRERR